jgi:hypothetical protein
MGREAAPSREAAAVRGFSQRVPRHSHPSVPAWDQAGPALPWWESVLQGPQHVSLEPPTNGSQDSKMTSFSPEGETVAGERGWTPMKRILMALAGLAALFLAAGANARYP